MAVSIADMERVALGGDSLRFDNDFGNVIELGDLSDDLGLSMLANPSKVSVNHASSDSSRVININSFAPAPAPMHEPPKVSFGNIDVSPLEPLEPIKFDSHPIDMNSFGGPPVEVQATPAKQGFFRWHLWQCSECYRPWCKSSNGP